MTQHPHAPEERRGHPAVVTPHTVATTAANRVRYWVFFFSSFSLGGREEEGQGSSLWVEQRAQDIYGSYTVHKVHGHKFVEHMRFGRFIQVFFKRECLTCKVMASCTTVILESKSALSSSGAHW